MTRFRLHDVCGEVQHVLGDPFGWYLVNTGCARGGAAQGELFGFWPMLLKKSAARRRRATIESRAMTSWIDLAFSGRLESMLLGEPPQTLFQQDRPIAEIQASSVEPSPEAGTCSAKESEMATEPKRKEPDIPPQKPDIQPEPRPEEIPQDKNFPEKESPPMQL
jgi:hypothetical protein